MSSSSRKRTSKKTKKKAVCPVSTVSLAPHLGGTLLRAMKDGAQLAAQDTSKAPQKIQNKPLAGCSYTVHPEGTFYVRVIKHRPPDTFKLYEDKGWCTTDFHLDVEEIRTINSLSGGFVFTAGTSEELAAWNTEAKDSAKRIANKWCDVKDTKSLARMIAEM